VVYETWPSQIVIPQSSEKIAHIVEIFANRDIAGNRKVSAKLRTTSF
jgi:hypothetical protein